MTLRADHVAGAAVLLLGIAVFWLGSDLPFGRLSAPGAGMMPKLMAGLMMAFALAIMIAPVDDKPLAAIDWSDRWHALLLVAITAGAVWLYARLGFLLTMSLLVFALLVVVERRHPLRAGAFAIAITLFAYWLFGIALKAPLERGIFWL